VQAFDDVKSQVASSIQQYTILQEQLRRLEHDNKRLKDLLETEKSNSALIAGQMSKLAKDIQTADSEVSQYREQRNVLMSEITSHKTTIVTYDGRFSDMQRQINMLHGALQAERKDNDEMRNLLQESRDRLAKSEALSFSHPSQVDDLKDREVVKTLHGRLSAKEDECVSLKKLLVSKEWAKDQQSGDSHTVAASDAASLQLEIIESKKLSASVQAENEILRLQLQSAQSQLRQKEQIAGYNSSSSRAVDVAHYYSNGSASKQEIVSSEHEPARPAADSRPSSGPISDGISEIGTFLGSFASRVQSSVVQAASSVTSVASSVTSVASSVTSAGSVTTHASSVSAVNSSSVSKSYTTVAVESSSAASVHSSVNQFFQSTGDQALITNVPDQSPVESSAANYSNAAPDVVGTGLFISSSKTQDAPVRCRGAPRCANVTKRSCRRCV
jgi:hypothetical protein